MTKYIGVNMSSSDSRAIRGGAEGQCVRCDTLLSEEDLLETLRVCPACNYHFPVPSPERISQLADEGSWREVGSDVRSVDPLHFFDTQSYADRLTDARSELGVTEAFTGGCCLLSGHPVALGVMDFRFLGGSMGSVVGERFSRLTVRACQDRLPLVIVTASGGARMQEGILSLMQMAKTVVALEQLADEGLPFITVLTDPTTGGVLASFSTLADIILAEPGALLCFAGPRVIEQTTREKLPPDFGSAEMNLESGQVDAIVHRHELKERIQRLLALLKGGEFSTNEPFQSDTEGLPRRGGSVGQAFERVKKFAGAPRDWLLGRDESDTEAP